MVMKRRKIFSLILSILEQLALVMAVLWVLPEIGINIPIWGLILMMIALGAYSIMGYKIGKKAIEKSPLVWPAAGSRGKATTPLAPTGYVLIGSERWKASSTGANIDKGTEVTVVRVEGTLLFVTARIYLNEVKKGLLNTP